MKKSLSLKPITMKVTFFMLFCLVGLFTANKSYAQSTRLNFSHQNKTVLEIMHDIEHQTSYTFFYNSKQVDVSRRINISAKNEEMPQVLNKLFAGTDISYKIMDKSIVLTIKSGVKNNEPQQKSRKVKGTVVDSKGEPIIGATVMEKGSSNGTVTDIDGNFTLDVTGKSKLVVSYVGFTTQEAEPRNSNMNITLTEDVKEISEVVVVGYGVTKKTDFTGSLSTVNSEKIIDSHKQSAAAALQGTIAGVDITRNGNNPGSGFNIMVRGQNTISNSGKGNANGINTPLYVIDGMMMDNMNDIAPDDIERIDVLKDASSTAIYGSRGANGVVIVTTKKGSTLKEKTNVEYNGFVSFTTASHLPDMLNGSEYADYKVERYMGNNWKSYTYTGQRATYQDALTSQAYNNYTSGKSVDWVDALLKTAVSQNHSVRVYGSGTGLVYSFGVGYTDESGVTGTDDYKRYNFSSSADKDLNKYIKAGISIYTAYTKTVSSPETVRQAYRLNPLTDMYNADGTLRTFPDDGLTNVSNPLVEKKNDTSETLGLHAFGNVYLQVKPASWLTIKTQFSPDAYFSRYGMYYGAQSKNGKGNSANATAKTTSTNALKYTWTNTANFEQTFGDHSLSVMIGSEWVKSKNDNISTDVKNFATDLYKWYNLAAAANKSLADVVGSAFSQEQWFSFFNRTNYSYKGKYLFTMTGRYDGSSRLAAGHRWKFFPSAAVGWRITEEDFMKNINWIDNLKLRLSYGVSGNNNNVNPYQTQANIINYSYNFGSSQTASIIKNLANSELSWETTKEWNFGLDFSFLNGRINGTIDYYRRRTDNILMNRVLSEMTGYSSVIDNVGVVDNNGVEIGLNLTPVRTKDFVWNLNINYTTNHNEIVELAGGAQKDEANEWFVGQSVGVVWNYQKVGFWNKGDEGYDRALVLGLAPGSVKVYEADGFTGNWTTTTADKVFLGSRYPKWTGGITSTFNYKNWSLSVNAYTRQGQWSYSQFHLTTAKDDNNLFNHLNLKYWSESNATDNDLEWSRPGLSNPGQIDALLWQKTSFVKIGYITLGYDAPANFIKKIGLSKLHVYASCQNPFVFTDYKGLDPEAASNGTDTMYFMTRSFEIGLNLTF
jgi:TonB-linked SusC/RagA family outer membrane protein